MEVGSGTAIYLGFINLQLLISILLKISTKYYLSIPT